MRIAASCAPLCILGLALPTFGVMISLDDFDRSNSTAMGLGWTEQAPDFRIEALLTRSSNNALMTFELPSGLAVDDGIGVEVTHNGSEAVQYVALVLHYQDLANSVFVKIQDNTGSGAYNRILFNYGNNAGPWGGMTGGNYFVDIPPTTHARIRGAVNGDQVTLQVDGDNNGTWEQTYIRGGLQTASLGSKWGLGGFGNPIIDNFVGYIGEFPVPEPSAAALLSFGVLTCLRRRR